MTPLHNLLVSEPSLCVNREFLIDLLTESERLTHLSGEGPQIIISPQCYVGKIVVDQGYYHAVESYIDIGHHRYEVQLMPLEIPASQKILCSPRDTMVIPQGVPNHPDPLTTTVGTYIANTAMFILVFGDRIPYWNGKWSNKQLTTTITQALLQGTITPQDLQKFTQHMYFFGSLTPLFMSTLTEKALRPNPEILTRKRELIEQHRDALDRGDAVVMSQIEDELVQMDRDYLKGDPAMGYLIKGKFFDVHRKQLYITTGTLEEFGSKGSFNFIDNSFEEGWTQQDLAHRANEIRRGSYGRAVETAVGGADAKFLTRVFQNVMVVEDDCKTSRTYPLTLTSQNKDLFIGRYHMVEGVPKTITDKTPLDMVHLRSPMMCASEKGFCTTCVGSLAQSLEQSSLTMSILSLSTTFFNTAMSSTHIVKYNTSTLNADLSVYTV